MKSRWVTAIVLNLLALLICVEVQARKKQVETYQSQANYTFENKETEQAYALHVVFNKEVTVVSDDTSGFVGPFRNIQGNGKSHLVLSNPTSPIPPSSSVDSVLTINFQSKRKNIQLSTWWWTVKKGKRIGKKQKASSN